MTAVSTLICVTDIGVDAPVHEMPPKKKPPPAAAPLKAQGTRRKRTPTGAFDAAAGKDEYEPEKVIAERLAHEAPPNTK